jgi:hypothetical protein
LGDHVDGVGGNEGDDSSDAEALEELHVCGC